MEASRLVQILLPLGDREGRPHPGRLFAEVAAELAERFGGVTAYTRAPAEGLWTEGGRGAERDDVVIVEVMTDALDASWWREFRHRLERDFDQERIIIRAQEIALL